MARDHLIVECLNQWDTPTKGLIAFTNDSLIKSVQKIMDQVFASWKETEFFGAVWSAFNRSVHEYVEHQRDYVAPRALRLECTGPMTECAELWRDHQDKELAFLQSKRFEARAELHFNKQQVLANKEIGKTERSKKIQNDQSLKDTLGPDPFRREVEMMAKIKGYYNVASMRFIDHICQSLQAELFKDIGANLHRELTTALRVGEKDEDGEFLEAPTVEQGR